MFDRALAVVLRHEGGWVDHPADPGGETMYGITKRTAESHGYHGKMREIPMVLVEEIYRKSYWSKVLGDELPWPVAMVTFDAAVNSGVHRASTWLQRVVGTVMDGDIGDDTLRAVEDMNPTDIARDVTDLRLTYLKSLRTWKVFGRGWERRVRETLAEALS
jgi:lysozyme family protein